MKIKVTEFCAVIVTFWPDDSFFDRLSFIRRSYTTTVIVDNSDAAGSGCLDRWALHLPDVFLIENECNFGIAQALNIGIEKAKELGAVWITTFDQDSVLLCDLPFLVAANQNVIDAAGGAAVVGSSYLDPSSELVKEGVVCEKTLILSQEAISSGMSFPVELFDKVGGFDPDLFIDMVDHDYCMKAQLEGFKVFKTKGPVMVHSVGNVSSHQFFWKKLYTNNHSAARRYYYARNTVLLTKRYLFKSPTQTARHMVMLFKLTLLVLLFEDLKFDKIKALALGVWDGLRGKARANISYRLS